VQEAWLARGFAERRAAWTLLAQQVPVGRFDRDPDAAVTEVHMDKWDGAEAARTRLFDAAAAAGLRNLIVLAGDVHQNRANELRRNFDDPASDSVGVEFVATSVASNGDGVDQPSNADQIRSANPHLKYFNAQRGYVRHDVSETAWRATYMTLAKVSQAGSHAKVGATFVVEPGAPRLQAG
jgi:alkaline phosphatase D